MGIFQEYMNSKGKVETGKVDISGDRTDPMTPPNKPPGKNQKPYANSDGKNRKGKEKGFGDQGDKDLVFNYDTKGKGKAPAKIPTAEQRFASLEIVPLVCESLSKDPLIVESIVRELKQNGLLHILVAELVEHRETFHHLAQLMKNETYGPEICRKLKRCMNEEVAAPFHSQFTDEDEEDFLDGEEEDELGMGMEDDEDFDMGMGDELGMGDDMMGDEDMMGMEDDEFGDEFGLDDEMGMEDELSDGPPPELTDQEMLQMMRRMMGKA